MAFDPTGPRLLTGAATGDLSLWAIPSGTRIRHLRDVGAPMNAVAVSPDGTLLAGGTRDGAVQIWRADSGELQSQLPSRSSTLLAVEFDRTSQLVLATYGDGAVVVADVAQGMPVTSLEGPHNTVRAAHFDPSSQHVIAASWDGTARLWDASAPYRRWGSSPIADDCGITTTSEPDSRFLAVGCKDHPTRVWDTAHDQLLAELPSVSHVEGDFTSAFPVVSVAGDRAAIARGNAVEVYELPGGRLLHTIVHPAPVNAVAFASTGRDIISGAIDGSLLVARDGGALTTLPPATGGIDAVAFLPDGRVAAADAQQRLRFYDLRGVVVADLELPGRAMSLRSDGDRLVTVPSYLGDATPPVLVDLEHDRIITRLEGHIGRVLSARWASHQALTTGADGTARRWQGSSGRLVQTYRDSASGLFDATVTPDGWVVAGSADGLARFWDKASGRLLWALPAHKSQLTGIHVEGHDLVTRGVNGEIARWALPDPAHVISACSAHALCAIVPL
jgi:WD40 repeat protein